MSISKSYAVFGLGRYGLAVAKTLATSGADVLAVDSDANIVNSAILDVPFCKCADVTDPEAIKQLGIANIDVVIIAMANNLEASVLSIMLCKEAGVPTVIAKCSNEMHGKILSKVGADQVVLPEVESGVRLAKNLLSSGFVDMIELTSDASLIELEVRPEWVGKTLLELNLRKKYAINIIAIRKREELIVNIDPTQTLQADMKLVVIVQNTKLNKLKK